jgi:ribosomal protein L11 methylase PrmA
MVSFLFISDHNIFKELLSDVLQPGGKKLDVGSGTGILCAAFYEMVKTESQQ